jgi:anaerobic magnesium-protoporphyrin IX monomethyl ester cyclase
MHVLLVAGLGPTYKNAGYLDGTLFDRDRGVEIAGTYLRGTGMEGFDLGQLGFERGGTWFPLLRPRRGSIPHLTTFTLEAILELADVGFDHHPTTAIWEDDPTTPPGDYDAVLLSTSYIWSMQDLQKAVGWVRERYDDIPLVVGGQFTNLKYGQVMTLMPEIDMVVRGDGEEALPRLLHAMKRRQPLDGIPNLVHRRSRDLRGWVDNPFEYIDLEAFPSPRLRGEFPVIPYESMRGCPFTCKFCSFPFASPQWRYKSATKIRDDWARYADEQGAQFIKAMDSTFTVPPTRLRELLDILPDLGVEWEGYSRANVLDTPEIIEALAKAHCRFLSIGFESMSERTLKLMDKKVRATHNRRALELLREGDVGYRCSFMTGYPGETPEDFAHTRDFLLDEYAGHFMLSVFSISDETMPVWQDRERLQIEVHDPANPDYSWSHVGMDVHEARKLNHDTLDMVRRRNDAAVLMLWQADYQHWLLPHLDARDNLRIEKTVERIGMVPRDHRKAADGAAAIARHLAELARFGVRRGDPRTFTDAPLLEEATS